MQTNEVLIDDIEPDTLEELLQFVYTDRCDGIPTNASSLLTAADKYNIPRLKAMCEEAICDNIDVTNAANVLVLGYLHEAKNLQKVAVDFVTNNMGKVSETPGWKIITDSHPKIMNEVIMSIVAKVKKWNK